MAALSTSPAMTPTRQSNQVIHNCGETNATMKSYDVDAGKGGAYETKTITCMLRWAQEGKDKEGAPNGQFFMTEAQTKAASAEVLGSHKSLDGPA